MTNNNKAIWQYPWGYAESFLIATGLMILGFIMNYFLKLSVVTISWPINLYTGIGFTVFIISLHVFLKNKPFIKWLSSAPAAISSICVFAFLVLLMGFIPQNTNVDNGFIYNIGLTNLTSSFAFVLVQFFFLTTLGMITLRRSFPFRGKNIAFFINHFGLWLTLFAASLGTGDIQRVKITANKIKPVYSGINQNEKIIHDLGIAIQLKEFFIEEYPPKAFIIDAESGEILNQNVFTLEKGNKDLLSDWSIEVIDYYEYAANNDSVYYPIYDTGAVPAALVNANHTSTNKVKKGWISCGSFKFAGSYLNLSDDKILVMAEPEPKKYSSEIKIYTKSGDILNESVEVNKPVSIDGWKIYQLDYDHKMGKWSTISILELVKDPWLPVVYVGIFLIIIGACYIFWVGNKKS